MGNKSTVIAATPPEAEEKISAIAANKNPELILDDLYHLHAVPSTISPLSHLRKLSLARCRIAHLADLSALSDTLHELNISFNLLHNQCNWAQIAHLKALRVLDLSHNSSLTIVPSAVFALTNLESLNLSFTNVTTIPPSISALVALARLDVSCCKLTLLPPSINELTALVELNVYFNRLKVFPSPIAGRPRGLRKLHRFTVSQNEFESLPEELFEGMTELEHFDCWENRLSALPDSITQCTQLRILLATRNRLASYPPNFSRLSGLQIVNFDNNSLTALPLLATFSELSKLTLRGNSIATLPTYVPHLSKLKALDLRDNPFHTLPVELPRIYPPEVLLTSIPNEVMPCLYISAQAGVENFDWLKAKQVALVVNMAAEIMPRWPRHFNYLCVPCLDSDKYIVTSHLDMTCALIDSYVSKGKNVIVHCAQGRSRSGSVVVGYAMWKLRQNFETALQTIRAGRPMVQPNPGFARQLRAWGAAQGLPSPQPSPAPQPSHAADSKQATEQSNAMKEHAE